MINNNLKTVLLLGGLGGLVVYVGSLLGGSNGATLGLLIALVMNVGAYFFSDKLALAASGAKPLAPGQLPEVEQIVSLLAAQQGMPMPKLYLIDAPQPNAFATGRNPKHAAVAVTSGILQLMERRELEGVLAHELAHVKNRDILISTIAATLASGLVFVSRMAMFGGVGRDREDRPSNPIIMIAGIILAPLAATIIQLAISRSREFQADASGAGVTGQPLNLASALRKLEAGTARIPMQVNPAVGQLFIADPLHAFSGRRMLKFLATHPPIAERVERLEAMASPIH